MADGRLPREAREEVMQLFGRAMVLVLVALAVFALPVAA
jgi:hypothetical protein